MKKILFVLLALAAGCKKKGGDCTAAIDHSMELSKADMSKMPGMDDKMMGKLKDVAVSHCKDDKWPAEALKCMTDAKTESDAQACYGKLSQDQQQKMNQAMMDAMKSAMPAAPPPAAPAGSDTGSAPAGSDTGSAPAGAGSAPAGSGSAGSAK